MLSLFLFFGFTRNTVHLAHITAILSSCLQQQVPELSQHTYYTQSTRWRPEGGVAALYTIKWKNTTFTPTAASRKRPRDTALRFLNGKGWEELLFSFCLGNTYTSQHARRQKGISKTFLADLNVQR